MLLEKIYTDKLVSFEKEANHWQHAIKLSCQKLEIEGYVEDTYAQEIINCIEKFGPYIVIAPMVAMPHSTLGASGVKKTGIGLLFLEKPVSFDPSDAEKDAKVFFTLAANSHDEHLNNMMQLSEMLMDEDLLNDLTKVNNESEFKELINKYK